MRTTATTLTIALITWTAVLLRSTISTLSGQLLQSRSACESRNSQAGKSATVVSR